MMPRTWQRSEMQALSFGTLISRSSMCTQQPSDINCR